MFTLKHVCHLDEHVAGAPWPTCRWLVYGRDIAAGEGQEQLLQGVRHGLGLVQLQAEQVVGPMAQRGAGAGGGLRSASCEGDM